MITIIAACDEECGIGKDGTIPWYNKKDMQSFKMETAGQTVVMGRKTWDSLGRRELPDRENVILTNTTGVEFMKNEKVKIFRNIDFLCEYYNNNFMVIGGQQIYEEFLERDLVDYIMLTAIKGKYDCDTFFPDLYMDRWRVFDIRPMDTETNILHFVRRGK